MKPTRQNWTVPVSGALLLATAVSAEQDLRTYLNSTNRVTLSLRYGLNMNGRFKGGRPGAAAAFALPSAGARRTPEGDLYNYDNGYVLTDISGNAGNQTWYWGYDNSSQVNLANNTISFDRATIANVPAGSGAGGDNDSPKMGAELAYNYEIGLKDEWHHLRYGVELAVNWLPLTLSQQGGYGVARTLVTDVYGYTPGTTPPGYGVPGELPYQGSFNGPNFLLNVPPLSSVSTALPGATFLVQQQFDANLWGFRLGPYLEMPLSKRWSLHLSGGLAVGLLDGDASWRETLSVPGGTGSKTLHGGGSDTQLLWGYYVGLSAAYQISQHWGLEAGVQFQDLGVYDHNFGGRSVELDLSKSVFLHAGLSYSF
jgi:hypothetical protein